MSKFLSLSDKLNTMRSSKGFFFFFALTLMACQQDDEGTNSADAKLSFQFQFDKTQERLDGFGNPVAVATGNAAQSPDFNSMSVHYIEFVQTKFTQVEEGAVVYEGKMKDAESSNFETAIVWDEAIQSAAGEIFQEVTLDKLAPGTYEYLRASVTYQNSDVFFNLINLSTPLPPELLNQKGTLSSFIGFNTYIDELTVKEKSLSINEEKPQGFWAFEPQLDQPYQDLYIQYANPDGVDLGQAPPGSTTVVNLLESFGVSIPQGSCIVTGKLKEPLVITGEETEDLKVTLSFSVNQSFEWMDVNGNGEWDFDVSGQIVESVVDMGLRGLVVEVE
ncbi:MAG: hypothetical protein ACI9XB_002268 [Gammaproteobacteria bacterium]|jgi:hypothetical protein